MPSAPRPALTDNSIQRHALAPPGRQLVLRDTQPGFFLLVGQRSRTWMIQCDVRDPLGTRRTVKEKIGEWPALTARDARARAKARIGELQAEGRAPERRPDSTLGDAWQHLEKTDGPKLRPNTLDGYRQLFDRRMKKWTDTALVRFADNPHLVAEEHAEITAKHGPYAANAFMRLFRHLYRLGRARLDPRLPHIEWGQTVRFNREQRRKTGMEAGELAAWHKALAALHEQAPLPGERHGLTGDPARRDRKGNAVRREFHLLCLLSGSRPDALARARWEHLDMRRRALHFPSPKGGPSRAFDVPLSRHMLVCLARARWAGRLLHPAAAARAWIFPAASKPGHIVEWREERADLPKWGMDLRQSYVIAAEHLDISERLLKRLLNHATQDVTMGYGDRTRIWAQLLAAQERLSRHIMSHRPRVT
ncbi:integrase arm-type DNA-binding domain-containing protein [Falsiroseomonas sp.]|uniref:integrase arm-type DNA-binding domain-containing protein n=1 Tax=Falsiroseomonas sp. TaxID=2870721 RepID=UPI003566A355